MDDGVKGEAKVKVEAEVGGEWRVLERRSIMGMGMDTMGNRGWMDSRSALSRLGVRNRFPKRECLSCAQGRRAFSVVKEFGPLRASDSLRASCFFGSFSIIDQLSEYGQ